MTTLPTPDPPARDVRSSTRRPGTRPLIMWDVVVTSILLIALAFLSFFVSVFGAFLVMASDSCGATDCNNGLIGFGVLVAMGLPWVVLVATAALSIIRMVKRRIALWIPLVGAPVVVASWFLGALIASAGAPS